LHGREGWRDGYSPMSGILLVLLREPLARCEFLRTMSDWKAFTLALGNSKGKNFEDVSATDTILGRLMMR